MRKILIIITIFVVSKYSVRAQNSYSLDFDGEGDYVEIIDESAMIANADQMTLSGWIYPRGPMPTHGLSLMGFLDLEIITMRIFIFYNWELTKWKAG